MYHLINKAMEEKVIKEIEVSESDLLTAASSFAGYVKTLVEEDKGNRSMFLVCSEGDKCVCVMAGKASNIGDAILGSIEKDSHIFDLFDTISFAMALKKMPDMLKKMGINKDNN